MKRLKSIRFWLKLMLGLFFFVVLFFISTLAILYWQQDWVVQQLLTQVNKKYAGEIQIQGSHIAPFANFPYISIDLEELTVFEEKEHLHEPILKIKDAYLGFDLWTIIRGKYELKSIRLRDGYIKLTQHKDGQFNIANALTPFTDSTTQVDTTAAPFELHLKSIKINNVDIHKVNEITDTDLDAFVNKAKVKFSVQGDHTKIGLDALFEMNLIQSGDTTFIKHKHFDLHTKIDYDAKKQLLNIAPSAVKLENGDFNLVGKVDIKNEMDVDLTVEGAKPNFDLIIAFAPEELIPTLQSYDNKGKVYFKATVKGKTANGQMPAIFAEFGCEEGLIKNNLTQKKLDQMHFSGHFSNGKARNLSSMEFVLKNFSAKPDAGIFSGDLRVSNFLSPDINLKLKSEFNLDFLTKFFNVKGLEDLSGSVALTMNFHDIIDLQEPEKTIEKLNESYYTELEIKDLNFKSQALYAPFKNINLKATLEGHKAEIKSFSGQVGQSDISIKGSISDLPAILHHSSDSIFIDLSIKSKLLNLAELTYNDSLGKAAIDEQISDFSLDLAFLSSARAFTESPNLPVGEFFIRDLHANLKHYPHELHDFHADVFIEDHTLRIKDFSGEIDGSDFHITAALSTYEIFLKPELNGEAELEFDLNSTHLRLEDLFSYKGENYVPEDYRHEDFKKLHLHGQTKFHFEKAQLSYIDLMLDQLSCTMQIHDCRFENLKGNIHYEDEHIQIKDLSGVIGRSDLLVDLNYYLGKDQTIRKRDNYFSLRSKRLDLNQLLAWNPAPNTDTVSSKDHEAVFNIFDVPFTDITTDFQVGYLSYHKYKINNLAAKLRMQQNHYLYIDTCQFITAGGFFDIAGYFNGSNPKEIYFSPNIYLEDVDLDKLMVKFENFGQDHLVSENLHGKITTEITGKLRMHADMTPIIDQSNFKLAVEIVNGRLENYKPLEYVSNYFKDKNLAQVRFDTLRNEFEFKENTLFIPNMTINSSLGFIELWGQQDMDMNMDFYFKIPLKLVTKAVFQKLFKRKREEVDLEKEDAIQFQDENKKISYVHVNMKGNLEDYKILLKRDKKHKREKRRLRREKRLK